MVMYIRDIDFFSVFYDLRLNFGSVLTVLCFCFSF